MLSSIIIVITLSKTIITIKQQQCSSLCFLSTIGRGPIWILNILSELGSEPISGHCICLHQAWLQSAAVLPSPFQLFSNSQTLALLSAHLSPLCPLSKFVVFSRWFPRVFPFLISTNPPFPRSISQGHCTMGYDLNTSPGKSKLQNNAFSKFRDCICYLGDHIDSSLGHFLTHLAPWNSLKLLKFTKNSLQDFCPDQSKNLSIVQYYLESPEAEWGHRDWVLSRSQSINNTGFPRLLYKDIIRTVDSSIINTLTLLSLSTPTNPHQIELTGYFLEGICTHRNIEGRVWLDAGAEIVHVGVVAGVVGGVHAAHRSVGLLRA